MPDAFGLAIWTSPCEFGLDRGPSSMPAPASFFARAARCCSRRRGRRGRARPCGTSTARPASAPTAAAACSIGDLYSSVRPCSAACRCGSPVPPNHRSSLGFAFSAAICANDSPGALQASVATLMPVSFSNSVAASAAPLGLHRADDAELCARAAAAAPGPSAVPPPRMRSVVRAANHAFPFGCKAPRSRARWQLR